MLELIGPEIPTSIAFPRIPAATAPPLLNGADIHHESGLREETHVGGIPDLAETVARHRPDTQGARLGAEQARYRNAAVPPRALRDASAEAAAAALMMSAAGNVLSIAP